MSSSVSWKATKTRYLHAFIYVNKHHNASCRASCWEVHAISVCFELAMAHHVGMRAVGSNMSYWRPPGASDIPKRSGSLTFLRVKSFLYRCSGFNSPFCQTNVGAWHFSEPGAWSLRSQILENFFFQSMSRMACTHAHIHTSTKYMGR